MLVPAFARGLDLITAVGSGMPLVETDAAGARLQPLGFTARPTMEPGVPDVTLLRRTFADLVAYGWATWGIDGRLDNGYPAAVGFIAHDRITTVRDTNGRRTYTVDGRTVPAGDLIVFDSGTEGALASGWYTLRTALALEAAANNYADDPLPSIILKSAGIDLDDDEAGELLDAWGVARRTRSTAYLNSQVDAQEVGWSAAELQLTEARQHSAIEVARILNLDPTWVGAGVAGSSQTYRNQQELNLSLLNATVLPLSRVVEQRLSMLSPGRWFRFDTAGFMRANLADRVAALTAYVAAGIMTIDEARTLEPLISGGLQA